MSSMFRLHSDYKFGSNSSPFSEFLAIINATLEANEIDPASLKPIGYPDVLFEDAEKQVIIFTKASGEKKFKKFRELLKQGGKQDQVLTKGTNNRKKNKKISWKSPLATWDRS